MKPQEELELKTILSKSDFERLISFYQPLNFERQHNYYYVTNDITHYAFRVRVKENEKLFTLKQKVCDKLMEYETLFEGDIENNEEILETLASFGLYPPFTIFGDLITDRAVYYDGLAELCFDINNYNGITDYEIEYEVKQPHDHLTAFKNILAKADIEYIPNPFSKYKRCLNSLESNK